MLKLCKVDINNMDGILTIKLSNTIVNSTITISKDGVMYEGTSFVTDAFKRNENTLLEPNYHGKPMPVELDVVD